VKEYGPGEYFGELSLLKGEPRAANIIAQVYIYKIESFKIIIIR
jgi:Cyclic nucleotide-binding domain